MKFMISRIQQYNLAQNRHLTEEVRLFVDAYVGITVAMLSFLDIHPLKMFKMVVSCKRTGYIGTEHFDDESLQIMAVLSSVKCLFCIVMFIAFSSIFLYIFLALKFHCLLNPPISRYSIITILIANQIGVPIYICYS